MLYAFAPSWPAVCAALGCGEDELSAVLRDLSNGTVALPTAERLQRLASCGVALATGEGTETLDAIVDERALEVQPYPRNRLMPGKMHGVSKLGGYWTVSPYVGGKQYSIRFGGMEASALSQVQAGVAQDLLQALAYAGTR